ncbi:VOC family protein [Lutibacter holmesii]|uniref:VOC family protein n=1 Tax=Lutibacter holmesii TaxID=1137985 RepID=A0ABW3WKY6_9FLAO
MVDKVETTFFTKKEQQTKPVLKRVTGIGGLFFKTNNPTKLKDWYKAHLGFNTDDYGATFWWKDKNGNNASTQWSPFKSESDYFSPSKKEYMFNYRVDNLVNLLHALKKENVTIVGEMETYDYGKFAWILDPDGNKIELWEPIDAAFL